MWGAATAAYQVEGAAREEGRGLSVWDAFCDRPGAVFEGHTGDVACDHYHRFREDVALMKELGLDAYRCSISWSRLFPEGVGARNEKGFDFYNKLFDTLLEAGIEPAVTLFHWDFPLELYRRGGWMSPDSPKWFGDYAEACAKGFGDRVKIWMTHNEPQCFIGLGHQTGRHAPGDKLPFFEIRNMTRHALLAHGYGVQALRAHGGPAQIGIAPVGHVGVPASDSAADIEAARRYTFDLKADSVWEMDVWMDPILSCGYKDSVAVENGYVPKLSADDLKVIGQPIDFVGLNIYFAPLIKASETARFEIVTEDPGAAQTMFRWFVRPDALYWGSKFFAERWSETPIYITENGLSNQDWVALDGKVHDPQRIDFLHRYLKSLSRVSEEGADIRGYFHWSLLDNFEWAEGYKERFGLIHIDYETLKRTPKDSFYWYKNVIATNAADL